MENIVDEQEIFRGFLEEAELQQYFELFRDILKVSKLSQLKFVANEDLGQIGLSRPEQRRYKKVYSKYYPNSYMAKLKRLLQGHKRMDTAPGGLGGKPPPLVDNDLFSENNTMGTTKHIISMEDITINKELGMGQFGVVQQGTWINGRQRLQVAIKCLVHEKMTSNSTEFLKEAAVMHTIEHPNIVRLYGVVLHLDSLMLVTELAPLRSLLECLREVTFRCNFSVSNLCEFAEQICDGMIYLENKRLIHRDLAARNILVFNKDKVKISDFGLSRALGVGKDYYQTNYNVNLKLPVAWCAPECILFLRFTSASDVWAYGVCLWEMFTYGFQPWIALSGQQILEAIDTPNCQRLERPECCPDDYYKLMLECWSHEPADRPKFKEIGPRLKAIRPEEVQTIANSRKLEEGRRSNFLEYKTGQRITVLSKEVTKSAMWYGALPGGTCGVFDPNQTRPYVKHENPFAPGTLSPHPTRNSTRTVRTPLLRTDVKRHTFTNKRSIERSMISSPQGDVKHTGHVGLDGAYFGDVSFLDPAGRPPRQVVTPYKPSEDLEETPLINPNSPSHLTGATCTPPYPLSPNREPRSLCDGVDASYTGAKPKAPKKSHKSTSEPVTSRSLLNKVKLATIGRSHKDDDAPSANDEVHEYHEISDTDTESLATDMAKIEFGPESPGIAKCADFSQSLLDEMESIFKNLEDQKEDNKPQQVEVEAAIRIKKARKKRRKRSFSSLFLAHTMHKPEKKKSFATGTMKPMSSHDMKTLDTAVAMANEITTKSMNDLDSETKPPTTPCEKSKFHFKFPLVSSLHHITHHDSEKDNSKTERRNFSDEARSVPDIQETLTEESKLAYVSLIEQPTPSSSLINKLAQDTTALGTMSRHSTVPRPAPRTHDTQNVYSLQHLPYRPSCSAERKIEPHTLQEIPVPPRDRKPKLVDKPRHFRKYPLLVPPATEERIEYKPRSQTNIYQNTASFTLRRKRDDGVDECDGRIIIDATTRPVFKKEITTTPNPFNCYLNKIQADTLEEAEIFEEVDLRKGKDHVSVEDLLEFADQKPSSKQRGVESDEVRIMNKVLKQQVSPEECLEALEQSEWNVHLAIKILRVKIAVGGAVQVTFEECRTELQACNGDITKASTVLIMSKQNDK